MKLTKSQLEFFFDEVLGDLGWCDEIEETEIDPLDYVRDEISNLRRHIKRLERSLELREGASIIDSIYRWFFENVSSIAELDHDALEFSRCVANEMRRTYEKLQDAEQGMQRRTKWNGHYETCPAKNGGSCTC